MAHIARPRPTSPKLLFNYSKSIFFILVVHGTMSSYLSTLMWSFLPGRIAQTILPTLSSTFPRLLPPAPPGTEAWRHNYRRVLTAVVILALAYNSFSVMRAADVDWYDLLGVGPRAGDDELRRAFRQLSRVYHPDRLGPNPPPNAEAHFIAIRQAYETLTDPVKRYAYDRFGPSIASWQKVDGMREYILRGAQSSAGFYIGTIGFMLVLALLGRAQQGAYWRNMLLGVLLMYEATLILTPTPEPGAPLSSEPILAVLPKWVASTVAVFIPTSWLQRPAYQHIALLHRLFTDISIAISQLAAEWSPQSNTQQQVLSLSGIVNSQAVAALSEEIGPVFASTNDPAAAERNLLDRIEALHLAELMEHHPAVAPAWNEVMGREIGKFARAPAANVQANGQDVVEDGARPRTVRGSTPRTRRRTPGATPAPADGTETLAAATNTPLPPSPPSTPLGGARRRSARLGAL